MHNLAIKVHISALLGCKHFIVTNAAGGAIRGMAKESIVIIKDYVNLIGMNPMKSHINELFSDSLDVRLDEEMVEIAL